MRLSRKKGVKKNKTLKRKYFQKGGIITPLMQLIKNKKTQEHYRFRIRYWWLWDILFPWGLRIIKMVRPSPINFLN